MTPCELVDSLNLNPGTSVDSPESVGDLFSPGPPLQAGADNATSVCYLYSLGSAAETPVPQRPVSSATELCSALMPWGHGRLAGGGSPESSLQEDWMPSPDVTQATSTENLMIGTSRVGLPCSFSEKPHMPTSDTV